MARPYGSAPPPTSAERCRRYRAKNREALNAKKREVYATDEYRASQRAANAERYLTRPFVAWDGEGVTVDGDHRYVQLAVLADGEYTDIVDSDGIATIDAIDMIWETGQRVGKNAIHVGFSFGYDINKILKDLPRHRLAAVAKGKAVYYRGYRVEWMRSKYLRISKKTRKGVKIGHTVTIYDVWAFFQGSFIAACLSYLGDRFYKPELIIENKAERSHFRMEDLHRIREYNHAELTNLAMMMDELRSRLFRVGMRPAQWFGPGAIVSALFREKNIKQYMAESPARVLEMAEHAYVGGRFEMIKFGIMTGPIHSHDINSAYPAALLDVPSLAHGHWREARKTLEDIVPFGLYRVAWRGWPAHLPGPFPTRTYHNEIIYPVGGSTIVWGVELLAAARYREKIGAPRFRVVEGWLFVPDEDAPRPFAFIKELYEWRRELKAAGDGAEKGIKLALNSMYGKLAQQVGAREEDGEWVKPPFHQIEWSGYCTAYCRAKILDAITLRPEDVIAIETDSIFVLGDPLELPISGDLGEWDSTTWESLTYAQSGVYWGTSDGKEIAKSRGSDRGSTSREQAESLFRIPIATERTYPVSLTRFIGLGDALMRNRMEDWGQWRTLNKDNYLGPSKMAKRQHWNHCPCHDMDYDAFPDMPHLTRPRDKVVISVPPQFAWRAPSIDDDAAKRAQHMSESERAA